MSLTSRERTPAEYRPLSKTDRMWFGQFKGMTVEEVMQENPKYLLWALDNVKGFDLEVDVFEEVLDFLFPPDVGWINPGYDGWEDQPY